MTQNASLTQLPLSSGWASLKVRKSIRIWQMSGLHRFMVTLQVDPPLKVVGQLGLVKYVLLYDEEPPQVICTKTKIQKSVLLWCCTYQCNTLLCGQHTFQLPPLRFRYTVVACSKYHRNHRRRYRPSFGSVPRPRPIQGTLQDFFILATIHNKKDLHFAVRLFKVVPVVAKETKQTMAQQLKGCISMLRSY